MKKRVIVLGSTGSIGTSCLEVIQRHPEEFLVVGLTAGKNVQLLAEQISCFQPEYVGIGDTENASDLKSLIFHNGRKFAVFSGRDATVQIINSCEADIIVNGLVGSCGLLPTLVAVEKGITLAIANKESFVMAGTLITQSAKTTGAQIIPVDSEHNAIWQCLVGEQIEEVQCLYLTASGGPFFHKSAEELDSVTVEEALRHPNWKMGKKVTIDSATMMNKGLEVIEARWLFGIPPEKIAVIIHPQSIIHSFVEFVDGSIKAEMGFPDMKIPIQYALTYPRRSPVQWRRLDILQNRELTFFPPDDNKFPCIRLAYMALEQSGTAPAVLNSANETAVNLFLEGNIKFRDIHYFIKSALHNHTPVQNPILDDILKADEWARSFVLDQVNIKKEGN